MAQGLTAIQQNMVADAAARPTRRRRAADEATLRCSCAAATRCEIGATPLRWAWPAQAEA